MGVVVGGSGVGNLGAVVTDPVAVVGAHVACRAAARDTRATTQRRCTGWERRTGWQ